MNITNIDLKPEELKEIEQMINQKKENLEKNCDLMLVLSNDKKILLVKRDKQILLQTIASLEM